MVFQIELTTEQIEQIALKMLELSNLQKEQPSLTNTEESYLTINDVSSILKISESTIRKHQKIGIINFKKIGGRYRITRKEFENYVNKI